MAVEVIHDTETRTACFYDNTTGSAFGPVFQGIGAGSHAEGFLDWLKLTPKRHAFPRIIGDGADARDYSDGDLRSLVALFEREVEAA